MNRINLIRLILIFVAVGIQSPLVAKTKKILPTGDVMRMASATFISTNASGCISTEINISGQILPGRKASSAMIDVFKRDDCKDKILISGIGKTKLTKKNISFSRYLRYVSLKTKIKVFDAVSQRQKPIKVKVKWEGFGKTIRSQPKIYAAEPGKYTKKNTKVERKTRHADAFGEFVILGKKNKFERSDDATLTLIKSLFVLNSGSGKRSIPVLNDDPIEEN